MQYKSLFIIILALLFLGGCGSEKEKKNVTEDVQLQNKPASLQRSLTFDILKLSDIQPHIDHNYIEENGTKIYILNPHESKIEFSFVCSVELSQNETSGFTAEVYLVDKNNNQLYIKDINISKDEISTRNNNINTYYKYIEKKFLVNYDRSFEKFFLNREGIRLKIIKKNNNNAIATTNPLLILSDVLPKFAKITQILQIGTGTIDIDSMKSIPNGVCKNNYILEPNSRYQVFDINGSWKPNVHFNEASVKYTKACIKLQYNKATNSFTPVLMEGTGTIDTDLNQNISSNTLALSLNLDKLDEQGNIFIKTLSFTLPRGSSFHTMQYQNVNGLLVPTGKVSPRGSNIVSLDVSGYKKSITDDWDTFKDLKTSTDGYFHPFGLPFYISIGDTIRIDTDALHFFNTKTSYIHKNYTNIRSNDIKFSASSSSFTTTIDKNGIHTTTITFADGTNKIRTLFPNVSLENKSFSVKLENSKLVRTTLNETFAFTYKKACLANTCTQPNSDTTLQNLSTSMTTLNEDGAIATKLDGISNLAWGAYDTATNKSVFEIKNTTEGVLYIPGFIIDEKNPLEVANNLLGSRELKKDNNIIFFGNTYSTQEKQAQYGNYFFSGITVGPTQLVDTKNSVNVGTLGDDLDGNILNIALAKNFSDPLIITSNHATKYVISNAGITGVFNSNFAGSRTVYGYNIDFSRFAFGVVDNILEKENWIDGAVSIPNNGGFKVAFENFYLDCSGALQDATIAKKDCQNNLNCNQSLYAWNTPVDFVDISFQNTSQDQCSNTKELKIGMMVTLYALKERLGLTSIWTKDGDAKDTQVTGHTLNRLDYNQTKESGYKIALGKEASFKVNKSFGWFENNPSIIVPFWEKIPTTIRLRNKSLDERELSLVVARDVYPKLDMNKSNSALLDDIEKNEYNISATYKWGETGINLQLPVYYESTLQNVPVFKGRALEYDLKVLSANAGINYITPYATKTSFGASADFATLKNLKLHVDLNDPKSLKEIDDFLATVGINNQPLTNSVGKVVEGLKFGNALVDKGLILAIEKGSVAALESLPSEVDPFEIVATTTSKYNTLPSIIANITAKEGIFLLHNSLNDFFDTNSSLNNYFYSHCNGNKLSSEGKNYINKKLTALETTVNDVNKSKIVLADIQKTLATIDEITKAIHDINATFSSLIIEDEETQQEICSFEHIHENGFLKPLKDTLTTIHDIDQKLKELNVSTVLKFTSDASKLVNIDSKETEDAINKVIKTATYLQKSVSNVNDEFIRFFNKELCPTFKDIQKSLQPLYSLSEELSSAQKTINQTIIALTDALKTLKMQEIRQFTQAMKNRINDVDLVCTDTLASNAAYQTNIFSLESYDRTTKSIYNMEHNVSVKHKNTKADELRTMVVMMFLDSKPVELVRIEANKILSPVSDELNKVSLKVLNVLNVVVNKLLAQVSDRINQALQKASSAVKKIPISSAKMDGYGIVEGDELSRLHIDAQWSCGDSNTTSSKKDTKSTSYSFKGSFDMQRWGSNSKAGCSTSENNYSNNMTVTIATYNIGLKLGKKEFMIDELSFGFTLDGTQPIGVMGGITSKKGFQFEKFRLYDMGLFTGIGKIETYMGAKCAGEFDAYQLQVAFLFGRTCDGTILTKLDPEVGTFITMPPSGFNGAYLRGGVSFPIYNFGCAFRIGVGANVGMWYLIGPPKTYGGLVAGEAYGELICLAALKGYIQAMLEQSGDTTKFAGYGWGAAGIGKCEPATWKDIPAVREDSWCGTGDIKFGAEFKDKKWNIQDIEKSAID